MENCKTRARRIYRRSAVRANKHTQHTEVKFASDRTAWLCASTSTFVERLGPCAEHRTGVRCLCMRALLDALVVCALFALGFWCRCLPLVRLVGPRNCREYYGAEPSRYGRCATSPVRACTADRAAFIHIGACSGECCRLRTHKYSCADRAIEPHRKRPHNFCFGIERIMCVTIAHRSECRGTQTVRLPSSATEPCAVRWYQWQKT